MGALPSGLAIADLQANLPCRWSIFSKAKRGPRVRWGCSFCGTLSAKKPICPMENGLGDRASMRDGNLPPEDQSKTDLVLGDER